MWLFTGSHDHNHCSKLTMASKISDTEHFTTVNCTTEQSDTFHSDTTHTATRIHSITEDCTTEQSANTVTHVLEIVSAIVDIERIKEVSSQITKLGTITDHPVFNDKSKEETVAIQQLKEALQVTFVYLRSYITKCYELAGYICNEEEIVLKTIKEGNMEDFNDYLEEVLSKSKGCQNDLKTLLEYIETKEMPPVTSSSTICRVGTVVGGATAVTGAGLVLAGPYTVAIGVGALALGVAAVIYYNVNPGQESANVIKIINDFKDNLQDIKDNLQATNDQLKEVIDRYLVKYEGVEPYIMSQQINTLEAAAVKDTIARAKTIKDYCQPFMNVKSLEDFLVLLYD